MLNLLQNFFLFQPQNASLIVWLGCGGIWLIMAITLVSDVIGHPAMGAASKVFWTIFLIALPILSGLFYAAFCLAKGDWSTLNALKPSRRPRLRGATSES